MVHFDPVPNAALAQGLVLRVGNGEDKFLRITHVFDRCVYCMWVSEPEKARYARRPQRKNFQEIGKLASQWGSEWGRITLPPAFSEAPELGSAHDQQMAAAWSLVEPLIELFNKEVNLAPSMFAALIRQRADATQTRFIVLRRLVLRFYYFGGTRLGLLALPRGAKRGTKAYISREPLEENLKPTKRRGKQRGLAEVLGANNYDPNPEN